MEGVQVLLGALGFRGSAIQVLETLPGADALLGCLLRNIQFATKCQAAFGTVIYKQHRVTVMALKEEKHSRMKAAGARGILYMDVFEYLFRWQVVCHLKKEHATICRI